jgi:uncharacterized membrane protein
VQLPALAAWAWIPIVIWAAFAQTVRNAAQRSLTAEVGTLAATLVRFLYGLPFAALWVAALYLLAGAPAPALPAFGAPYFAWVLLGAVAQLAATAFLHELPGWLSALAMGVATLGVLLLSLPKAAPAGIGSTGWVSRAAGYGLASGAGFALSAVGYRGAALALDSGSPLLTGAWGVLWAQAIQSLLLGGYLAWRQPRALMAIARSWRLSTLAGMMGALASIGWFTAFSLRPATDVRTLGLVEVLFSYLVSRRIFHEKLGTAERVGLALVLAGLVGVCAQL